MKERFTVELLEEAVEFIDRLEEKTREKVYYNIKKSQFVNDRELFKKLNEHIWEFRTLYKNKAYRLFSFWDNTTEQKTLVIATHGIVKKTQKIPQKEIDKQKRLGNNILSIKTNNYEQEIKNSFA